MKFGVHINNRGPGVGPDEILAIAEGADELGYDSVWVGDHIIIPAQFQSVYPYGPPGSFTAESAQNYYEPLTALTFVAGRTRNARLGTTVMLVPYRNPVYTAKIVSTLDNLSKGRVILGIGVGWLEEEFWALNAPPFAERGPVTDEYIRIYKELWTKEAPVFEGKYYSFQEVRFMPKPVQKPYPPIWVGGHSRRALRRVAEHGDGWICLRLSPDELLPYLDDIKRYAERYQRKFEDLTICNRCVLNMSEGAVSASGRDLMGQPAEVMDIAKRFERVGVSYLTFDLAPRIPLKDRLAMMERFAKEVMPAFRG